MAGIVTVQKRTAKYSFVASTIADVDAVKAIVVVNCVPSSSDAPTLDVMVMTEVDSVHPGGGLSAAVSYDATNGMTFVLAHTGAEARIRTMRALINVRTVIACDGDEDESRSVCVVKVQA